MSGTAFFTRSKDVVGRFLQTAVVVDDRASFGPPTPAKPLQAKPTRGSTTKAPAEKEEAEPDEPALGDQAHDLDVGALIETFAGIGIVCAALKPSKGSEKLTETDRATQEADIVVLDWWTDGEDQKGDIAKKLLRKILETDTPSTGRTGDYSRRFRLVAIYTGENDLEKIAEEIQELLSDLSWTDEVSLEERTIRAWPVTVKVYGKPGALEAPGRIPAEELPDQLVDDFTEMTSGLLSNVALESLSTIRTNTHRILNRFHSGLDASYVSHRALSTPPQEAEEHTLPLVASEIESVLADDERIRRLVNLDALSEWLQDQQISGFGLDDATMGRALLELLEVGVEPLGHRLKYSDNRYQNERNGQFGTKTSAWSAWDKAVKSGWKKHGALTEFLAGTQDKDPAPARTIGSDEEFAMLTSLRAQYDAPPPTLRLGTIVRDEENRHWLCVQPLCDGVRIEGERAFPFLKLEQSDKKFDLVVPADSGEALGLKISYKLFEARLVHFQAGDKPCIEAARGEDETWNFVPSRTEGAFQFIADLKPAHANRIANDFGREISRVGLMESEWLRRHSK